MIRQIINVDNKWKVIVYYNIDYNFFNYISRDLQLYGCNSSTIRHIYYKMYNHNAYGFTYSSPVEKISVVGFNAHKDRREYINTIVHEAEHIKQAMLSAYSVDDEGEPPAYTIGYLVMEMYKVFKTLL